MSKSLKRSVVALALASGLAGVQSAKADALAASDVLISNLLFQNAATNTTLTTSDFVAPLLFSTNASVTASLNGLTSTTTVNTPAGSDLYACAPGSVGCPANNTFPFVMPPPTTTFSEADQLEVGAPIAGLVVNGTPVPVGATVDTASNVSLATQAEGGANATNGLSSTFEFALAHDTAVNITFDATLFLDAFTAAGSPFPTNAFASSQVCFTVTPVGGSTAVINYCPGLTGVGITSSTTPFSLNQSVSVIAPVNGEDRVGPESGSFSATTVTLTGGTLYRLSASEVATSSALEVPEPGTLALVGLGLLGFVGFRRRSS
jgi:hypothetical protein